MKNRFVLAMVLFFVLGSALVLSMNSLSHTFNVYFLWHRFDSFIYYRISGFI